MPSLDSLLAGVFERKGYALVGADADVLVAQHADHGRLLCSWKTDGAVSEADARQFIEAKTAVAADKAVLIAPRGVDPDAKPLLSDADIDTWPESRLIVEVGEAFVKDALAAPRTPTPAAAIAPAVPEGRLLTYRTAQVHDHFGSMIARAASASTPSAGNACYMPNRPRTETAATPAAPTTARANTADKKVWGGGAGLEEGRARPGVADFMPNRPRSPEAAAPSAVAPATTIRQDDDIELMATPQRSAPSVASTTATELLTKAASQTLVQEGDIEIMSSPRRVESAPPAQIFPGMGSPTAKPTTARPPAEYEIFGRHDPQPERATPTIAEAPAATGDVTSLRLTITTPEGALEAVGKSGVARLALSPQLAFSYDVNMTRADSDEHVQGQGILLVDATNGAMRSLTDLVLADVQPQAARQDAPKLTATDVFENVKQQIAKHHTRTIVTEREVAGNSVRENVRLVPTQDEMGLTSLGLIHLPIWEITAATGVARVDAHTGEVL